jgi:glutaredoxin 3
MPTVLLNDKMQRPLLDTIASFLFQLETNRVKASSQIDDKGRFGEPMEWSQDSSLANRLSQIMADKGYFFKQWVADIIAGDYNREETQKFIQTLVQDSSEPVVMFSFTTCPFCRRAKDLLDEKCIPYKVLELDELDNNRGNEIRSMLGVMTRRTSVPSIFIRGKPIGGLNDGMPGLQILNNTGALDRMLAEAVE